MPEWAFFKSFEIAGFHFVARRSGIATRFHALGFYLTDVGDNDPGSLTYTDDVGNDIVVVEFSLLQPDYGEDFFGIISDVAFSAVQFANSAEVDLWGIDEVYYGVPEPLSAFVLASASAVLVFCRRWPVKRYRQSAERCVGTTWLRGVRPVFGFFWVFGC